MTKPSQPRPSETLEDFEFDDSKPMTDEARPKPEETADLDDEEREFRALRRDLPGVKGAGDVGILTVSVGRQPTPKHEFYRTNVEFRPVVPLVNIEVGMDKHYIAVAHHMIEPLSGIGITVTDHTLYLIITPRGGLRTIPVAGPNSEGEQNEYARTKEAALIDGIDGWVRMFVDKENSAYKSFPAPPGRFGDPAWIGGTDVDLPVDLVDDFSEEPIVCRTDAPPPQTAPGVSAAK